MKRIAIVTGASSGMGREFVLQLQQWEQVDEIWVIARREAALQQLQAEVSVPVRPVALDLAERASLEAYRDLLAQEQPRVAVLVNGAGYGKFGRHDQIPLDDALGMIDLNDRALVAVTELTLPYMDRGDKIVQLGSLSSFQPVPYLNVYAASKAFVLSYTRGLARELRPRGIRVMAVCPGWVRTPFFDRAEQTSTDAVTYFNHVWEAGDVVDTALRDLYRTKKDVSIHGRPVRNQVRLVKLLPHSLVMSIWLKQQKHGG